MHRGIELSNNINTGIKNQPKIQVIFDGHLMFFPIGSCRMVYNQ